VSDSSPTRRSVLQVGGLALLGSVVGCTGSDESGSPRTTDNGNPTDSTLTSQPVTNTVSIAIGEVQPDILEIGSSPTNLHVQDTGNQYIRVLINEIEVPVPREDFRFRLNGVEHSPMDPSNESIYRYALYGDEPYSENRGRGWLIFKFPKNASVDNAAVIWPGGKQPIYQPNRKLLNSPTPPFSVDFRGPETLPTGEQLTLTVEVTNEGKNPGQFVAGINVSGVVAGVAPAGRVSVYVPSRETRTASVDLGTKGEDKPQSAIGDDEVDYVYTLVWSGGEQQKSIRLVED